MSVKSVVSAKWPESVARGTGDEVQPFLGAIASVLRETVAAFEATVSRVTEITVMRPGKADRDLVVVLQEFDRLQQEFSNLSEVIARLSLKSAGNAPYAEAEALATISIADLKDRLARHVRALSVDLPAGDTADEVVF
jgi:hypothetical protein